MNRENRQQKDPNELWEKRPCPAYQGNEPYVYLSFAPFELAEGLETLSILNRLGCRVCYDENMLTGRPWTGRICDAIEGCAVFFEVKAPGYRFSLTRELSHEFAYELEKKSVIVRLYNEIPTEPSPFPRLIYSSLNDPSYPEHCRSGLEDAGYFSAVTQDPAPVKYDLMLDYYMTKEDWDRSFGGLLPQKLNLRTHESHGYLGHYPRSDEDVFCAVRYSYKKEHYYLRRRSEEEDYKPDKKDRLFTERIRLLNGDDPDDLERKYVPGIQIPKPGRPFPAGYPYKDEFEYLGSDDD